MRTKADNALVRRNLTLHAREANRLGTLRDLTEASSDSEVVRQALRHYQQYIEDQSKGISLFVAHGDDTPQEILVTTGRDPQAGELVRRNLVLHERSMDRLDALKAFTKAASDSEVIRQALRLYEILVDESSHGGRLYVGTKDAHRAVVIGSLPTTSSDKRHTQNNSGFTAELIMAV